MAGMRAGAPSRQRARPAGLLALGLLGCLGCLASGPAWAHGGLGDGKSIWGGALHCVTSPLSLAALLGLVAALFGVRERLAITAAVVAGVVAAGSAALASRVPVYGAPAAVVLLGLAAVAAWEPPDAGVWLLAVLGGAAAGLAADLDTPTWQGVIGVGAVVLFLLGCTLSAAHDLLKLPRLTSVLPIARRILGSWVAAMGLLMTALAVHLGKS